MAKPTIIQQAKSIEERVNRYDALSWDERRALINDMATLAERRLDAASKKKLLEGAAMLHLLLARTTTGAAIQYQGKIRFVTFKESDPVRIYWSGGPSWCILIKSDNWRVLKRYEFEDYRLAYRGRQGEEVIEFYTSEAEQQFYKDFPLQHELKVLGGWLGPDGKYYPCHGQEHVDHQYRLSIQYYDDDLSVQEFQERGWVHVHQGGLAGFYSEWSLDQIRQKVTQAQIDAFFDLSQIGDEEWQEQMRDNLKYCGVGEDD